MNLRWVVALAALVGTGTAAKAQVAAYLDFSGSRMTNLHSSTTAFGPTFGVQVQVAHPFGLKLDGDLRGYYYTGGNVEYGTGNLNIGGFSVGPKLAKKVKKVEPYVELLVGFARYNDGLGHANSGTTDSQLEIAFGADYQVTKRFDWRVAEFSYKQFYYNDGEFNPKTFSTGIVFHVGGR